MSQTETLKAYLIRGDTCAHNQLRLIEDSLAHPLHAFIWTQVMLLAILCDAVQKDGSKGEDSHQARDPL